VDDPSKQEKEDLIMTQDKRNKLIDYIAVGGAILLTAGVLIGVSSCAHAQDMTLPPPPPPPPVCAVVTYGPPLNMRAAPNGQVLAWLYGGDQILIDGAFGRWAHVASVARFDFYTGYQTQGWVFGPYLLPCGR
jgi:hypothetical protein